MRYLADTDWVIDALAGRPDAVGPLRLLSSEGVAVSIVSLGEIYEGAFDEADPAQKLARYRRFLDGFPVVPLSDSVMVRFARERARLRKKGATIPDLDLLIGVSAVQHGLRLMTRNVRHFSRVEDLRIYVPE